MNVSVTEAVDMLYHGKANVIMAANACGVDPNILKQLLLEKVQSKPEYEPLQLTLPFI